MTALIPASPAASPAARERLEQVLNAGAATARVRALDWEARDVILAGRLLDEIIGLVPELERRLAGGLEVLEANSGNGAVLRRLATRFPASLFEGMDRSPEAYATAVTATTAQVPDLAVESEEAAGGTLALFRHALALVRESGMSHSDTAPVPGSEDGWLELLTRAGLVEVEATRLPSDGFGVYLVARA